MKGNKLQLLLTQLTNFARYLTAYPLYLFAFSGVLKEQGQPIVLYTLLAMVCAFAAMLASVWAKKHCKRVIGLRLIQVLLAAASATAGVFVCRWLEGTVWMCIASAIVTCLYSVIGSLSAGFPLKRWEFFVAAFLYLFTVVVLSVRGYGYPVTVFIVQFVVIAAIFALKFNFQNIDFLMRRRGHRMNHLPGKIRLVNLILLFGGLALAVVLVLCRGFFMDIAGRVFQALLGVLYVLATPLRRWWNNDAFWDREIDMPTFEGEDDPEDAFEQLTEYEEREVNVDLQVDLLVFLAVALAIFLLIRFRRPIFEFLGRVWNAIVQAIMKLFRRLGSENTFDTEENEYYTDIELDLTGERTRATSLELRAWKKQLRAYHKMPDGREKYLTGFVLSAHGLQLHGVPIAVSDTPLEILEKSRGILDPEGYRVATQSCNALAFGAKASEPAWTELQTALETLRTRKPNK